MVEGMPIQAIELQIESDAKKASKGLDQLKTSLQGIKSALNGGLDKNHAASTLEGIKESAENAAPAVSQFGKAIKDVSKSMGQSTNHLVRWYRENKATIDGMRETDRAAKAYAKHLRELQEFDNLALDLEFNVDKDALDGIVEELKEMEQTTKASFGTVVKNGLADTIRQLSTSLPRVVTWLKSAAVATVKFVNSGVKHIGRFIAAGMQKAASAMREFVGHVNIGNTAVGKLFNMVKRVAIYRAIRSALKMVTEGVKEGVANLNEWSHAVHGSFATAMDAGANAALKFKNSIGAMVSPVIEAVMPLLVQFSEYAIRAANAINQFLSALFGRTVWTRAIDVTAQAEEKLKDSGKAAKQADKDLKGLLADWDELNIIQQESASSPGGGAGSLKKDDEAFQNMFETVALGKNRWTDLAKEIRDAVQKGDWAGVGTVLATHLNEAIAMIQPEAIADKINEVIGNALEMANAFLSETDFYAIGKKMGAFLLRLFVGNDYMNWELYGTLLRLRLTAIIQSLKGVVETKGLFESVGKALATLVNSFFEFSEKDITDAAETFGKTIDGIGLAVSEFIHGTNFSGIGEKVNSFLMQVLSKDGSLHAGLIGDNIRAAIVSAFDFVRSVLGTGEDDDVLSALGTKAADLVNGLFDLKPEEIATIGDSISTVISRAFNGITNFFEGVNMDNFTNAIKGIIENIDWLGIAHSALQMVSAGAKLVRAYAQSIREAFITLKTQVPGIIDAIGEWLVSEEGLQTIVDTAMKIGEAILEGISLGLTATEGLIKNLIWIAHEVVASVVNDLFGSELFPKFVNADAYQKYLDMGESTDVGFVKDSTGRYKLDDTWKDATKQVEYYTKIYEDALVNLGYKQEELTDGLPTLSDLTARFSEDSPQLQAAMQSCINLNNVLKQSTTSIQEVAADSSETVAAISDIAETTSQTAADAEEDISSMELFFDAMPDEIEPVDNSEFLRGLELTAEETEKYANRIGAALAYAGGGSMNYVPGGNYIPPNMRFYASGGFPTVGEMFIARESGPEMVGRMGSRSAVANNAQIVEGVASGVAAGQAEQNALLRQQNAYLLQLINKRFTAEVVPSRRFAEVSRQSERMLARSTGGA